ncbi:hypothetical protein BTGOE4_36230 [Bacillus thuringiensis]|uniref:Uncharacterized protein n=2 Tax=Bacillus thuringiensis TaxID=1428 RepID=A0A9X5N5C9_BACTU|nr:hypothetical protein BTGOE4_36230 [Bacillus thuringiensis]
MEEIDMTTPFADYLGGKMIDSNVDQPLTTWRDSVDGNGNGSLLKARGNATIRSEENREGVVKKLIIDEGEEYNLWIFDFKIKFRYESVTHGETWACVLNKCTFVNNDWDEVHPEGTVIATFNSVPSRNLELKLDVYVDPDSDDRPGKFIQERVASKFRDPIALATEDFTGLVIDRLVIQFHEPKYNEFTLK